MKVEAAETAAAETAEVGSGAGLEMAAAAAAAAGWAAGWAAAAAAAAGGAEGTQAAPHRSAGPALATLRITRYRLNIAVAGWSGQQVIEGWGHSNRCFPT